MVQYDAIDACMFVCVCIFTNIVIMKKPVKIRRNLRSQLELINFILRHFSGVCPKIIPMEMKKVSRMLFNKCFVDGLLVI